MLVRCGWGCCSSCRLQIWGWVAGCEPGTLAFCSSPEPPRHLHLHPGTVAHPLQEWWGSGSLQEEGTTEERKDKDRWTSHCWMWQFKKLLEAIFQSWGKKRPNWKSKLKKTNSFSVHLHVNSSGPPKTPQCYQHVAWTPLTCDPLEKEGPIGAAVLWELEGPFTKIQLWRERSWTHMPFWQDRYPNPTYVTHSHTHTH